MIILAATRQSWSCSHLTSCSDRYLTFTTNRYPHPLGLTSFWGMWRPVESSCTRTDVYTAFRGPNFNLSTAFQFLVRPFAYKYFLCQGDTSTALVLPLPRAVGIADRQVCVGRIGSTSTARKSNIKYTGTCMDELENEIGGEVR